MRIAYWVRHECVLRIGWYSDGLTEIVYATLASESEPLVQPPRPALGGGGTPTLVMQGAGIARSQQVVSRDSMAGHSDLCFWGCWGMGTTKTKTVVC